MLIKDKRLSKALTQKELAQQMGVQRATVSMWESGKAYPRTNKLVILANIFNCTVEELFFEKDATQ